MIEILTMKQKKLIGNLLRLILMKKILMNMLKLAKYTITLLNQLKNNYQTKIQKDNQN